MTGTAGMGAAAELVRAGVRWAAAAWRAAKQFVTDFGRSGSRPIPSAADDAKMVSPDVARMKSWGKELICAWRKAWDDADPETRHSARHSLEDLSAPVQLWIYLRRSAEYPFEATVVGVAKDSSAADEDVRVSVFGDRGDARGDAPAHVHLQGVLDDVWRTMCTNWTPDRPPDPPPSPPVAAHRVADGLVEAAWRVGASIADMSIPEFVEFCFRPPRVAEQRTESSPTVPAPVVSHICRQGQRREAVALERWLELNGPHLPHELGVPEPWWCGIFLPRASLFGDAADGDVDIVAGKLEAQVTKVEWKERYARAARKMPLTAHPSRVAELARLQAEEDRVLRWPDTLDYLVGCEAKASWYQLHPAGWKATHVGEARRIVGQLELLLERGFDRVAFLHLGATEPRDDPKGNPWFLAGDDALRAEDGLRPILSPSDVPQCGIFTSVIGAVAHAPEDWAGSGGLLRVHRPALPNPSAASPNRRQWRATLRDRLVALGQPRWFRTFVVVCEGCGAWSMSPAPYAPASCSCKTPPAGRGGG